jgi:hypothetical protein
VILLIMSAGLVLGIVAEAYIAAAAWSLLSILLQSFRLAQALRAHRRHPLSPWLG